MGTDSCHTHTDTDTQSVVEYMYVLGRTMHETHPQLCSHEERYHAPPPLHLTASNVKKRARLSGDIVVQLKLSLATIEMLWYALTSPMNWFCEKVSKL